MTTECATLPPPAGVGAADPPVALPEADVAPPRTQHPQPPPPPPLDEVEPPPIISSLIPPPPPDTKVALPSQVANPPPPPETKIAPPPVFIAPPEPPPSDVLAPAAESLASPAESSAAESPLAEPLADEAVEASLAARLVRGSLPWATSLCVNLLLMVLLAFVIMPSLIGNNSLEITFLPTPFEQATAEDLQSFEMTVSENATQEMAENLQQLVTVVEQPVELEQQSEVKDATTVTTLTIDPAGLQANLPARDMLNMPISVAVGSSPPGENELKQAGTVEQAVDGIGGQIRGMLGEGDTLVVWLFDASISLVDDRQRIAARLDTVYADIGREQLSIAARTGAKPPLLMNAVVAYGGSMAEVVAPTKYTDKAIQAIANTPIDQTGLELVMEATARCVTKYRNSWKNRQILIVIWTDESGDDILLLEPTIALCRKEKVQVSVIGPTATLGAQGGLHAYFHPVAGRTFYLPVMKGPDTAFPERLLWPYWSHAQHSRRVGGEAWDLRGVSAGWHGGPHLRCLSSGFAPYALTRLAMQTGGTMTIFDREADRGPFTLDVMRPYSPDYRSAAEIYEDLRYQPLRQMVLHSLEITRTLEDPEVVYPLARYYHPADNLRNYIASNNNRVRESANVVEMALLPFQRDNLEFLREQEPSPRWRAWYDLTHGRLLAQSVRYAEFLAMTLLATAPGGIPDDANCVTAEPIAHLWNPAGHEARAREAERLLQRCIDENPQTPFAILAAQELASPLGFGYKAFFKQPPPPPPPQPYRPPGPTPPPLVFPKL